MPCGKCPLIGYDLSDEQHDYRSCGFIDGASCVVEFRHVQLRGEFGVIWLSLSLAGLASLPAGVAFWIMHPPHVAGVVYLLVSCVFMAAYFSLLARAYEGGEISLVYPICRGTGVALTAMMALLLSIETLRPTSLAGVAAVIAGIFLIGLGHVSGDLGGHSKAHSVGLALLVGICIMSYSITDKLGVSAQAAGNWPGGGMHPVTYICGQHVVVSLLLIPYVMTRKARIVRDAWRRRRGYVLFIGPASLVTYLLIVMAYSIGGPVSSIVAFREFAVVLGCVLGFAVLKEKLTARKLAGIAIVLAGLVLIKLGYA